MTASRRPRRAVRMLCVLLLAVLLGGCGQAAEPVRRVAADIGGVNVIFDLPRDLVAHAVPGGVTIRHRGGPRRRIYDLSLARSAGAPALRLDRRHGHGTDTIRYGVVQEAAGSGGPDITLVAERRCGGSTLRLRLDTQAEEGGVAELEPAFDLLASARCTTAARAARRSFKAS